MCLRHTINASLPQAEFERSNAACEGSRGRGVAGVARTERCRVERCQQPPQQAFTHGEPHAETFQSKITAV